MDPIDEAWPQVEAEWGNIEAHRRFVAVCVALNRLPEAGKRYREVRENDPDRRNEASKQIDTLIVLAAQQLQDTRVEPAVTDMIVNRMIDNASVASPDSIVQVPRSFSAAATSGAWTCGRR